MNKKIYIALLFFIFNIQNVYAGGLSTNSVKLIDNNNVPYGIKQVENKIRVLNTSYLYDIAKGLIPGHSLVYIFGYNADVDNVREDMWEIGGTYVFPASPIQMKIVSSSIDDTAAGTGARTVDIHYLDNTYTQQVEAITLNGTTPVNTVATNILRINNIHTMTAGTNGLPVGNISLQNIAGTITYSYIIAGLNASRQSIYTVPAGKTLYITSWDWGTGNAAGNRFAEFLLRAKTTFDNELVSIFHIRSISIAQDGDGNHSLDVPIKILATSDIKISVISDTATANAICYGGFEGWLE